MSSIASVSLEVAGDKEVTAAAFTRHFVGDTYLVSDLYEIR